jgi:hypothetical protein
VIKAIEGLNRRLTRSDFWLKVNSGLCEENELGMGRSRNCQNNSEASKWAWLLSGCGYDTGNRVIWT